MTKLDDSPRRSRFSVRALLVSAVTALLMLVAVPAGVASAHTSFERSSPSDGATISEPLEAMTLEFSGDTEYGDDGFTVLTSDGVVRTPTTVSSSDQRVFELTFDPPLAGGAVGVRWSVNAPDAHPISGAFSFTVNAPSAASNEAVVTPSAASSEGTSVPMVMADDSAMDMSTAALSLDDFLAAPPARAGEGTARWGRLIGFAAITLIIGGAAFTATTLRGRRTEIDRAVAILRILGATLAVGALMEYVGVAEIADASISGYWSSQPGMATLLRVAGGLAIAAGLVAVTVPVRTPRPAHSLSAAVNSTVEYEREEDAQFWTEDQRTSRRPDRHITDSAARTPAANNIAIDPLLDRNQQRSGTAPRPIVNRHSISISTTPPPRHAQPLESRERATPQHSDDLHAEPQVIRRWLLDRSSAAACIGVTVAVISFWFDGHTVSKGIRPLHALVNSVHVVAGSVWLGGVVAMAVVLWSRHRSGIAPRALEMVVRFSGIATVALGAVVAAGGLMAVLVLDSFGELINTQWGQVLLLKSAAVALAMLGGGYNHFKLLPALEAEPDDPKLIEHLRAAVTSEAILLGFVVVVTASLVSAAS